MKLFLIRHGETVDNVAGVYAGITDSALTNHGVLQAYRLGAHLAATDVNITHIFSSDLTRAFKTAEAVRQAQPKAADDGQHPVASETVQLAVLREQDFGSLERKAFTERPRDSNKTGKETYLATHRNDPDFRDVESKESMRRRADTFIDEHLMPLLDRALVQADNTVVIVAHGIILNHLWRCTLRRFASAAVAVAPGILDADGEYSLDHLGAWSNTGYLELDIWPRLERMPAPEVLESSQPPDPAVKVTGPDSVLHTKSATNIEIGVTPVVKFEPVIPVEAAFSPNTEPEPVVIPQTTLSLGKRPRPELLNMSLVIKAVNSVDHLKGLKKTRGGIGSSAHDEGQKTIESFFKKRKIG